MLQVNGVESWPFFVQKINSSDITVHVKPKFALWLVHVELFQKSYLYKNIFHSMVWNVLEEHEGEEIKSNNFIYGD